MGEVHKASTVSDRLEQVMRGRSVWKWADSVHLSSGAVSRMLKGQFPDPEKLVPACRVENLSLTWLLEGRGTPFCVACPATDAEAADIAQQALQDDPAANILIGFSDIGFTVVVHTPVYAQTAQGKPYEYKATTIVGGCAAGEKVTSWLTLITRQKRFGKKHQAVRLDDLDWIRLASGYMGNFEIFGESGADGLYGKATHGYTPDETANDSYDRHAVRDPAGTAWINDRERADLDILRALSDHDRDAASRMLRGLGDQPKS